MKIFAILAVLGMLASGCGTDRGGSPDDEDFFRDYYPECVALCELCMQFVDICGDSNSVNACVWVKWNNGNSNNDCSGMRASVAEWVQLKHCTDEARAYYCSL